MTGVVMVGEPDRTTFVVPVEVVTPVPPLATGKVPVTPVVSGSPVAEVKTIAVGVPSAGVISVGEVENTRFVDVVPVAPAAVKPDILLNAAIPALVAFVPPSATVTGAVSENTVPVSVSPVDAVYDPASVCGADVACVCVDRAGLNESKSRGQLIPSIRVGRARPCTRGAEVDAVVLTERLVLNQHAISGDDRDAIDGLRPAESDVSRSCRNATRLRIQTLRDGIDVKFICDVGRCARCA